MEVQENRTDEKHLIEENIPAELLEKEEPIKNNNVGNACLSPTSLIGDMHSSETDKLHTPSSSQTPLSRGDFEETKTKSISELKAIIENLLFVSSDPLPLNKIIKAIDNANPEDVTRALFELQLDYNNGNRGLRIQEIANGFMITTCSEYWEYIKKLYKQRERTKLSQAALETLAVIAYKQPITRAEVESIRGVDSSVMIRNLIESGLIDIVGKKEVIGRPHLYGTTNLFLKTFGLRRLNDLPSIEELKKKIDKIEG